jgi:hypothetical protein
MMCCQTIGGVTPFCREDSGRKENNHHRHGNQLRALSMLSSAAGVWELKKQLPGAVATGRLKKIARVGPN